MCGLEGGRSDLTLLYTLHTGPLYLWPGRKSSNDKGMAQFTLTPIIEWMALIR